MPAAVAAAGMLAGAPPARSRYTATARCCSSSLSCPVAAAIAASSASTVTVGASAVIEVLRSFAGRAGFGFARPAGPAGGLRATVNLLASWNVKGARDADRRDRRTGRGAGQDDPVLGGPAPTAAAR